MAEIKISQAEVNKVVELLDAKKMELDGYATELESDLEGILSTAWKSTNAKKYITKMKEPYCEQLKKIGISLDSFSRYLENVFHEYQETDEELANEASGIEV